MITGVVSETVTVKKATFVFSGFGGTVLGTDQRSDTHVSGSGAVAVADGNGFGYSRTTSEVSVVRDIWLRDGSGKERHVRVIGGMPLRQGHVVYAIHVAGTSRRGVPFNSLYMVYNATLDEVWTVSGLTTELGSRFAISWQYWAGAALFGVFAMNYQKPLLLIPLALVTLLRLCGVPGNRLVVKERLDLLAKLEYEGRKFAGHLNGSKTLSMIE